MKECLTPRRIAAHKISCYVNVMEEMEENYFKFRSQEGQPG
jgi:hypothetical protein